MRSGKRVVAAAVVLAVALGAGLLACNGLLGIGAATLAADDAGDVARGLTCPYYCQTINRNCTGANSEYLVDPPSVCLAMCQGLSLDQGATISASDDNTLGCRIHYAEQAANDPATNCRFAGALGGGRCGTDACGALCTLDLAYCNAPPVSTPAYASIGDCTSACNPSADGGAGFPLLTTGPDLPAAGNTLNCRFYHLQNAYPSTTRGQTHCPHTEPVSMTCF